MSFKLIYYIKWSKTQTSICSISRPFGVRIVTLLMLEINAYMLTIGKTSEENLSNSIMKGISARIGKARTSFRAIQTVASLNTDAIIRTDGKRVSTIHSTSK